MGHALYRKYRPLKLSDVAGQEHITKTLDNAIKQQKIAHAYLLTGPRGVGKTSVARILAHEINKLKYNENTAHIDIIEIDAASNRGIEEIRDLREKVYIAPTSSEYKVYIIDEVHMLTTYAFNALLKTLEEPPEHVIFILATTDAHKLPETIISRTQRYNFKSVSIDDLVTQLSIIANKEKININKDALELIAEHSQGSFRDAISMLDQLNGHNSEINSDSVYSLLGVPSNEMSIKLLDTIYNCQNLGNITQILEEMYQKGYQAAGISDSLIARIRQNIINTNQNTAEDLNLIQELLDVPAAFNPTRHLEIVLLKYARTDSTTIATKPSVEENINLKNSSSNQTNKSSKPKTVKPDEIIYDSQLTEDVFSNLLQLLKAKYNTLYSIVRMAEHEFIDKELVLTFNFPFHQKRVSEKNNQKIITDLLKKVTGEKAKLTCLLKQSEEVTSAVVKKDVKKSDEIKTVSNIFGGAELLES